MCTVLFNVDLKGVIILIYVSVCVVGRGIQIKTSRLRHYCTSKTLTQNCNSKTLARDLIPIIFQPRCTFTFIIRLKYHNSLPIMLTRSFFLSKSGRLPHRTLSSRKSQRSHPLVAHALLADLAYGNDILGGLDNLALLGQFTAAAYTGVQLVQR